MRLTNRRLAVLHFTLALIAVASCVALACSAYPEAEQADPSAALVQRYAPILEDAGLGYGIPRLRGVTIRVHPGSDGGSWKPEKPVPVGTLPDGGTRYLTTLCGYSGQACASYPGERVIWLAAEAEDSKCLCHEFGHIARSDVYSPKAGECVGPGDHEYFAQTSLDRKCAEAAP